MNRRRFLAAAGGAAATAGGAAGIRIANIRRYTPEDTVEASLPPGERIFEASRLLYVLDHRSVTRVTVLGDGTDSDPYRRARYRHERQPSRHRYRFVYTTFAAPPGNPPPTFPHLYAFLHNHEATDARDGADRPVTSLGYFSPGRAIYDPSAETPESPADRPHIDGEEGYVNRTLGLGRWDRDAPQFFEFVLTPDVEWERVDETEETVVYRTASREEYAKVPPIAAVARGVAEGSRITATLDRSSGRLLELDEHRVVDQRADDEGTRRYNYRVTTEFDRYGTAAARPPGGPAPEPSISERLHEYWLDFLLY